MNVTCPVCSGTGQKSSLGTLAQHCNACGGLGYQDDQPKIPGYYYSQPIVLPEPRVPQLEAEIAQLRAYRDKTEAALLRLRAHVTMTGVAQRYDLEKLGLWREPALPKDGGA